jgi:hypothetical protein
MLLGDFRQFSVERLLRFLVALNQDVEIVVRPTAVGVGRRRCRWFEKVSACRSE